MGCIYFVRAVGMTVVKIGFTDGQPASRISTLQIGSPVPLEPIGYLEGSEDDEKALHDRFDADWSHGEWFRISPELQAFMDESLANGSMSTTYNGTPSNMVNMSFRFNSGERAILDECRNSFDPPLSRAAAIRWMIDNFDEETMSYPTRPQ